LFKKKSIGFGEIWLKYRDKGCVMDGRLSFLGYPSSDAVACILVPKVWRGFVFPRFLKNKKRPILVVVMA
jgi:hypothetical protein